MAKENKRKTALKFCRYYNGKDTDTQDGEKGMIIQAEKSWVDMVEKESDALGVILGDYLAAGLQKYNETDDTPILLKAVIFSIVGKYTSGDMNDAVGRFKSLYKQFYE